jgi:hypothetical protein
VDKDHYKLHIKMGSFEFEAEGPQELVKAQFSDFKELIQGQQASKGAQPPSEHGLTNERLQLIFKADPEKKTISLRAIPPTNSRVIRHIGHIMLILLLGFKETFNLQEIPAITMTDALRQSGFAALKRLSTSFHILEKEGLALKIGKGKGTKYRATNKGLSMAQHLIQTLFDRINL